MLVRNSAGRREHKFFMPFDPLRWKDIAFPPMLSLHERTEKSELVHLPSSSSGAISHTQNTTHPRRTAAPPRRDRTITGCKDAVCQMHNSFRCLLRVLDWRASLQLKLELSDNARSAKTRCERLLADTSTLREAAPKASQRTGRC